MSSTCARRSERPDWRHVRTPLRPGPGPPGADPGDPGRGPGPPGQGWRRGSLAPFDRPPAGDGTVGPVPVFLEPGRAAQRAHSRRLRVSGRLRRAGVVHRLRAGGERPRGMAGRSPGHAGLGRGPSPRMGAGLRVTRTGVRGAAGHGGPLRPPGLRRAPPAGRGLPRWPPPSPSGPARAGREARRQRETGGGQPPPRSPDGGGGPSPPGLGHPDRGDQPRGLRPLAEHRPRSGHPLRRGRGQPGHRPRPRRSRRSPPVGHSSRSGG